MDKLGAGDFSSRGRNWTAQGAASRGSFDCRKAAADISSSSLSSARRLFRQQGRDSHEVVGEHSRSNPQLEAVMSLGETSLHAATSEQHRDAPLDAGATALSLLEVRALLVGFALRTSLAAALRNAHDLDAITIARCQVLFAEEAAIRAIQFRDPTIGKPLVGSRNCMARIAASSANKTWHRAIVMASRSCAFRSAAAREVRSAKPTRRARTSSKDNAVAPASRGASRCCSEVAA